MTEERLEWDDSMEIRDTMERHLKASPVFVHLLKRVGNLEKALTVLLEHVGEEAKLGMLRELIGGDDGTGKNE